MNSAGYIPYCGAPPLPGGATWNLEPHLLIALAAMLAAYGAWAYRGGSLRCTQTLFFVAGWAVLALALISPLCNLSVALFSARIAQHMIIVLIAAPLLVLGGVDVAILRALGRPIGTPGRRELALGVGAFAAAMWLWHMPGPYDATFRSDITYWAMHITMIASGIALWRVILRSPPGTMLLASIITGAQMAGLGAVIAFSGSDLYAVHAATTWAWGLTPLQDQGLGALIMWVPGGIILTLEALAALAIYLNRLDRRETVRVG